MSQSAKKAPGPDKINFQILRMIWEWDKMQITSMVQQVIRLGCYPKAWKRAWGILLEKGGKRDFGLVRSYRVISLLNCMGKVLEKAVAEQLFQFCKAYFKLHPGQMGARKERSREKSSNGWVHGREVVCLTGEQFLWLRTRWKYSYPFLVDKSNQLLATPSACQGPFWVPPVFTWT